MVSEPVGSPGAALIEVLRRMILTMTLDEAIALLSQVHPSAALREAKGAIERRISIVRQLKDPPAMLGEELESWYPGPSPTDRFWPKYRSLLQSRGWDEVSLQELDAASTRIVSALHHPGLGKFQTRGLVAGEVQSGKTASFTAVMSKAADVGYRMFIVLSGTTNKLRRQTQLRLDSELRDINPEHWITLTTPEEDFRAGAVTNINAFLTQYAHQKTLVVIKKHSGRLGRLLRWINSAQESVVASCPVLVIDDEADQASPNTAKEDDDRSTINAKILEILRALPKAAYVGYTATPYANFFIDASNEDDLYPRHFIIPLRSSERYFGIERIFGRERTRFEEEDADIDGLNVVRTVRIEEVKRLRNQDGLGDFEVEQIESLRAALFYFWMSTAARLVRGQDREHSSMLIHTSQWTREHMRTKAAVDRFIGATIKGLGGGDHKKILGAMRAIWEDETAKVPSAQFGLEPVDFDRIAPLLNGVLNKSKLVVENYLSPPEERLIYGKDPGIFIVIGGDVLSRGLTLDGLVTSYFLRSASAYDALMQMGRWFGYRNGYEDLPRIWMTDELRSYFFELGGIDGELRQLISKTYCGHLTPGQFAPLIRTHPDLLITSRLKMKRAEPCYLSYGDKHVQTILFNHQDNEWLKYNIDAARRLIARQIEAGRAARALQNGQRLILGVPVHGILAFLNEYRFHEESWNLRSDALIDYVKAENSAGSLKTWRVLVAGQEQKRLGMLDLGLDRPVNLVRRSRIKARQLPYANIKSLMSRQDALADLGVEISGDEDWEEIVRYRNDLCPDEGLLIIYPVDRMSPPLDSRLERSERAPLDAKNDVIGVALVFPRSRTGGSGRRYMTQDLSKLVKEQPDFVEEEVNEEEGAA